MNDRPGSFSLAFILDLPPAVRKFLIFTGINLISWQCIVGQMLVLFGRAIHMPPAWIGALLSFMPLSMLMVIVSIPAVSLLGSKRMLFHTWVVRNAAASAVFLIPAAAALGGERAAWHVLWVAILCFSLSRAFGIGAWYPWLHEIVPKNLTGSYFAAETLVVQTLNVAVAAGIAVVLRMGTGMERFYAIYALGVATGLYSAWYLKRIPGGGGASPAGSVSTSPAVVLHAWRDGRYRRFVGLAVLSVSAIMWMNVSSILYLRDVLRYTDSRIMALMAAGAGAVALTARASSLFSERFGSHSALSVMMGGQGIAAAGWCFLLPGGHGEFAMAVSLLLASQVCSAGFMIVAAKAMMNLVRESHRIGYTSLWIIGISLGNGIPPLAGGWLIDAHALAGYRSCFLLSAVSGAVAAAVWRRFPIEVRLPVPDIHLIVRPGQPLRSLQRIVWMILGVKRGPDREE